MFLLLIACDAPETLPLREAGDSSAEPLGESPFPFPHPSLPVTPTSNANKTADEDPSQSEFLWEEGVIHDFGLGITPAALEAASDATAEADVPATLTFGARSWTVGVRIKGQITRRDFTGKPSIKIDFHQYLPAQRFFGLRRITLNNMLQDKSMLKEHVSYFLHRTLDVPAPRHGYARLSINGEAFGLYGLLQTLDGQFVDQHWEGDDDGNLYEGGYGADLTDGNAGRFTVQQRGTPAPPVDLEHVIGVLDDATPETLLGVIATRFRFTDLMNALAIDLIAGNWDGYARAANNFLLYHAPQANRWTLIPWGQDQAFTSRYLPIRSGWEGRLLVLCGRSEACVQQLDDHVVRVLDRWEAVDLAGYAAGVADTLAVACAADPRAELPCSPGDVLEFLAERPAIVRTEREGSAGP